MTRDEAEGPVAVALGSNLGDRAAHLAFGVERLRSALAAIRVSSVVESAAWGGAAQPDYLNLVVTGETRLSPRALLDRLLDIERAAGRVRTHPGAPRTLDADLILYGDHVIREPGLTVPHPRWYERAFVARPLLELLPRSLDPETGGSLADRVSRDVWDAPLRDLGTLDHLREVRSRTPGGNRTRS